MTALQFVQQLYLYFRRTGISHNQFELVFPQAALLYRASEARYNHEDKDWQVFIGSRLTAHPEDDGTSSALALRLCISRTLQL